MVEVLDSDSSLKSTTVGVYRTAATVKGGRRFSFSSLVVVGDQNGRVGFGYGKANQVPVAIEKAQKEAKRKMKNYPLTGRTIPHEVTGRFGACSVRLIPASPGTGIIAGSAVRAPLEMLGLQDCLTKSLGSPNGKNLVKAVINGLDQLRSKQVIQDLRGVEVGDTAIEDAIKRGTAFMPATTEDDASPAARKTEAGDGKKKHAPARKDVKPKPEPKVEAKPEPKVEAKPEAEVEATPAADSKPEAEAKPEAEVEATPAADPKPEPAVEAEAKPQEKSPETQQDS